MAINVSMPEHNRQIRPIKASENLKTYEKVDAGIALAGLQSALAELTKLSVALVNSEQALKAAREVIATFRSKA
jgi:hypothetical protein